MSRVTTHYGLIVGPTPDQVQMIACGPAHFCDSALKTWIEEHPLEAGQEAEIVKRLDTKK